MFESIEIKQFRSIKNLRINNLKQFNLVIGATNIGKTTVLEALFLSVNPENITLIFTINSIRNITYRIGRRQSQFLLNFFYESNPTNNINIKATTIDGIRDLIYFAKNERDIKITDYLSEDGKEATASSKELSLDDLFLTINDKHKYKFTLTQLKEIEGDSKLIPPIKTKLLSKTPFKMTFNGRYEHIKADTNAFSQKYDEIVENNEKEQFLSLIHNIDHNIKSIEKIDKGLLIDYGYQKLLPLGVLGNGMIKILNVIAAIFCTKNGVVLIDELENGLHYEYLDKLWNAIYYTASKFNVQIIATTHSYDCIKSFNNKSENKDIILLRLEKELKDHECMYYNKEEIKEMIEEELEIR